MWFVSLADLHEPEHIPHLLQSVLGLPRFPHADALQQTVEALRERPALLILDNFEQLLPAGTSLVGYLLEQIPDLLCLVTSREPLVLAGERECFVAPLATPAYGQGSRVEGQGSRSDTVRTSTLDPQPSPETLTQFPSVQMFVDRAQGRRPDFQVTPGNATAVAALCERLEGLPLAIELAAAWIKTLTPSQLLERLTRRLELLVSQRPDLPARHRSMRATIGWSYRLLSPERQRFLARISVFRGGWTLEAAEAMGGDSGFRISDFGFGTSEPNKMDRMERIGPTGCPHPIDPVDPAKTSESDIRDAKSEIPKEDVLSALAELVDSSLITSEPVEQGGAVVMRFRMLETIREFLAEQLTEADQREIRRRHAQFFLRLVEERPDGGETDWLTQLDGELENIRGALAWSVASDAEIALRLGAALLWFWRVRAFISEGRAWLGRMLAMPIPAVAPTGSEPRAAPTDLASLRARALRAAGLLAMSQGDSTSAQAFYEEALTLYRQLDTPAGVGDILDGLSVLAMRHADHATAERLAQEALAIRRATGGRDKEPNALMVLGSAAMVRGEHAEAEQFYQETLLIHRATGERSGVLYSLQRLGTVAQRVGRFEEARQRYEESLEIARQIGDVRGIAHALEGLASLAIRCGEHARAGPLLDESLALRTESGDRQGVGYVLLLQGELHAHQGDFLGARQALVEGASILRGLGEPLATIHSLEMFAFLALQEGRAERAARLYAAAASQREAIGAPLPPSERNIAEGRIAALQAALGEAAFTDAWSRGGGLGLEGAMAEALS